MIFSLDFLWLVGQIRIMNEGGKDWRRDNNGIDFSSGFFRGANFICFEVGKTNDWRFVSLTFVRSAMKFIRRVGVK